MQVIGIDPGLTGALASIVDGELAAVHDLPICPNGSEGKFRDWIDAVQYGIVLRETLVKCELHERSKIIVVVERAIPMKDQHSSSTAITFDTFGVIRAIPAAMGCRVEFIIPGSWKRKYGLTGFPKGTTDSQVKRASIDMALQFYPLAPIELQKHHNRAEAILLARWGWQRFAPVG